MKTKVRIIALLLVLVMLLPMAVACDETAIQLSPAGDKTPEAGELAATVEEEEKLDAKALLLELLKEAEVNVNKTVITAKFRGGVDVSFLDPAWSFGTSDPDMAEFVDEDGYLLIPVEDALKYIIGDPDITNILKDMLIETALGGDYGSLEELLSSLIGNIDADTIIAKYGSLENYAAVTMIKNVLVAFVAQKSDADYADYFERALSEYLNDALNGETELVDLLEFIYYSDILEVIANGAEEYCGISGIFDSRNSLEELRYTIGNMIFSIRANQGVYNGQGNYGLEVYYPAIEENLESLFGIFSGNLLNFNSIDEESLEILFKPLKAYLSSEDGPVAELDAAKIIVSIAATALAYRYTCMLLDSGDPVAYAVYNYNSEKMFKIESDYTLTEIEDEFLVMERIGNEWYVFDDADEIFNVFSTYEDALGAAMSINGSVGCVYVVILGASSMDELPTVKVYNELATLLYSGIDAELEETDSALTAAAVVAYALTYFDYDNNGNKFMDEEFTEKFVLSALSESVLDDAKGTFERIAAIIGVEDDEETEDVNELDEFVNAWLKTVTLEDTEVFSAEDQIIALIINTLRDDHVSSELDSYYGIDDVSEIFAQYLYLQYFDGEGFTDDIPVAVAVMILSEYVYLYDDSNYQFHEIVEYIFGYYEDNGVDIADMISWEDLVAIFGMIKAGELEYIDCFYYASDYLKLSAYERFFLSFAEQYNVSEEPTEDDLMRYDFACDIAKNIAARIVLKPEAYSVYIESIADTVYVDIVEIFAQNFMMMTGNIDNAELESYLYDFCNLVCADMQEAGVDPETVKADEAFFGFVLPALFAEDDANSEPAIKPFLIYFLKPEDESDVAAINALISQLSALYNDACNDFSDIKSLDLTFVVGMLSDASVILNNFGCDVTTLNAFITKLSEEAALTPEIMLDHAFTEFMGEEYAALTDVILAICDSESEISDIVDALKVADDAILDDMVSGYLRAISAALTKTAPDFDGICNALAVASYAYQCSSEIIYVPAVLYMTKAEFVSWSECNNDVLIELREWVVKYFAQHVEAGDVEIVELVMDYLVITEYFDEDQIPEKTDENYYEKLVAVYLAYQAFEEEDAEIIADIIINPENLNLYGEELLGFATKYDNKIFYLISTKAFLDVEDSTTVDWEAALSYIPELVYERTGKKIEIANYYAFSEILRPVFAEKINTSVTATVAPFETADEIVYVFTVFVEFEHIAIDGLFEIVIEIRCPKEA